MRESYLIISLCVFVALCGVCHGSFVGFTSWTGVTVVGKLLAFNVAFKLIPAEAGSFNFFHRMGHVARSSEESEEDENESHGRIGIPKPQITSQNKDQCLAKLLCGMSVAASTKATKADYFKDYAKIVSRYFQVFGSDDDSAESNEAYDDYSGEDDDPPPPSTTVKTTTEKFDISLGFTSLLDQNQNMTNTYDDEIEIMSAPKRNRGAGKLSQQRLSRAERILEGLNREGRKPQPSQCQSITGCPYSFKELRAKLKSGTKGKISSASSPKAPMRYKTHRPQAKPMISSSSSSLESSEHQFHAFKDPHKSDDELDEIFGSQEAFAPAKPKKKTDAPPPPPPPPIYIRRTIIKKKKRPDQPEEEEEAQTTIIKMVQPGGAVSDLPTPIVIRRPATESTTTTTQKPKRNGIAYKRPPPKKKIKDNGDDEDDDINHTLPVRIITSDEYNDDHHKIYNIDNGYNKEIPPPGPDSDKTESGSSAAKNKKKKDDESEEEESEEEEEEDDNDEEDEENDDEDEDDSSKAKKKNKKIPASAKEKKKIVVEGDDEETKKNVGDDDEAAEANKSFWGGLTFVSKKSKEDEKVSGFAGKDRRKYKIKKNDKGGSKEKEEEEPTKENDEDSKEEEEDDKKNDKGKVSSGSKKFQGKLDIDIPPSSELDLAFPRRKQNLGTKKTKTPAKKISKGKKKEKEDSSSEEENASLVITEIGGRPLAPPKDPSLTKNAPTATLGGQASPFKLQLISPYSSKQKSNSGSSYLPLQSYSSPQPTYAFPQPSFPATKHKPMTPSVSSQSFLKSNLPDNQENSHSQGKPDLFSRFSSLRPLSKITNFFRKGNTPTADPVPENVQPSPFVRPVGGKRPIGPESSKFRRPPVRNANKKKNKD